MIGALFGHPEIADLFGVVHVGLYVEGTFYTLCAMPEIASGTPYKYGHPCSGIFSGKERANKN
jgi:hypothetical protein